MSAREWRPGYNSTNDKLAVGQRWLWWPETPTETAPKVRLVLQGLSPEGEVHLRPATAEDAATLEATWPPVAFSKENPDRFPFKRVDEKMAKAGSSQGLKAGDLLCHEAWDVWIDMYSEADEAWIRQL